MRRNPLTVLLASAVACLAPLPAAASPAMLFASPSGAGTACTQAHPCSLSGAVAAARRGDIVYLAVGTYVGAPAAPAVVAVTKSLKLRGGWDGTTTRPPVRTGNALATVIDGEEARRGVTIGGAAASVTFDGLTVTRGLATDRGGGIWSDGADLTLRRVMVYANKVAATQANNLDFGGGGVYVTAGALKVVSSAFAGNGALNSGGFETYGGAILLKDATRAAVRGSFFAENDARNGSGLATRGLDENAPPTPVTIRGCTFAGNGEGASGSGLGDYGGGVYLYRAAGVILLSHFEGNAATESGSAVYSHFTTLNMDRSMIAGNAAADGAAVDFFYGGGRLRNNVIADNAVGSNPFGVSAAVHLVRPGVEVTLIHNTIIGPAAAPRGIGVSADNDSRAILVNNIVGRFVDGVYARSGSEISAEGTLWGNGSWSSDADVATDGSASSIVTLGPGNLAGAPAFLDAGIAGPWRIGPASAARNAALADRLAVDIDGEPRGTRPDIGADEYMTRVLLTAPDGGQVLREGEGYTVRWGAPVTAETFKLSYSLDGGATWRLIAKDVTGRTRLWVPPQLNGTAPSCLVRVIGYDGGGSPVGSDRSDAVFTVRDTD